MTSRAGDRYQLFVRQSGFTRARRGFTLIELLVTIAILVLLIGILIPVLGKARAGAKLSVCRANLSQVGLALIVYAGQHREQIPKGPPCAHPFDFACEDVATSQLWIGAENEAHPSQPVGLGPLVKSLAGATTVLFCPADDTNNLEEELPRFGTEMDSYGSFTYRQLDQLSGMGKRGVLSNLGVNTIGRIKVPVEALAMDTNSLGPGAYRHTNHEAKKVNILYVDRSVKAYVNAEGTFSIPAETFQSPMDIFTRLDQIFINADYSYRHDPTKAPQIVDAD